jgi:hypothetical protein
MTLRWVLLSAVWNDEDMLKPYNLHVGAQPESDFNLADEGYSRRKF